MQPVRFQMDSDMAKEKQEEPMDVASMSALIEKLKKQNAKSSNLTANKNPRPFPSGDFLISGVNTPCNSLPQVPSAQLR